MTTNFTAEELSKIGEAPFLTGIAVSLIDLGLVSSVTEVAALSSVLAGAAEKYPNNSIIQPVFSEQSIKDGTFRPEKLSVKPEEVQSGTVVDRAITSINNALELVKGRASESEILEYKQFIYDAADAVAKAAGSGLFGSGEKVSDKEVIALSKIKATLGI